MPITKAERLRRQRIAGRAHRRRMRELVDRIKLQSGCVDCKQHYPPCVLQYDHIGTDKLDAIAGMVSSGLSEATILREIAKCEVVCANCHSLRTHTRRILCP